MGKLDGRVVLITGAARGQGVAEARLFAAEGARVVLADILDEAGEAAAREIGDAARYVHLDVSDEDDWRRAVGVAVDTFGKLDGLVNNAGILAFDPIEEMSRAAYLRIVEVNQLGTFLGMKTALPALRAAGTPGTIVNIASYAGLAGMAGLVAYASTKGAVLAMTRVAALEAGPRIRVNAICPGGVRTPMTSPGDTDGLPTPPPLPGDPDPVSEVFASIPLARIGEPDEIAGTALYLTGPDSSYTTGTHIVVDGGWMAGVKLF
ncbi:SDR family NAD(P)-dependent oxidoreductase [Embleya sp. AB8]|uniref:SDR family NAD(P)-dependent oxidoreductase n=1 Tax=Embleya sp. AB8 TaxID=3156304 RepID=UPI003C72A187